MQIAIVQRIARRYRRRIRVFIVNRHRRRQGRNIALRRSQAQQSVGAHRKVAADAIGISSAAAGYRQRCDNARLSDQENRRCVDQGRRQRRRIHRRQSQHQGRLLRSRRRTECRWKAETGVVSSGGQALQPGLTAVKLMLSVKFAGNVDSNE